MEDEEIRKNLIWLMKAGETKQEKYYPKKNNGANRLAEDIYEYILTPMGW